MGTHTSELSNARISVFCDNMGVVHMLKSMTSSCPNCMLLLRLLTLDGLRNNRRLSAKYISTHDNFLADSISRAQWSHFRKLGLHMDNSPLQITDKIWPIDKIWLKI